MSVGYAHVCHEADKRRLKVKLGIQAGDTHQPGYLNRLWLEDRDGDEIAAVHLRRTDDLDEAGDLLLEQLPAL